MSVLTPVLVLVFGIIINNSIKSAERSTSLRSDIYRTIGGDLNDIYSYLEFVGAWKELTPADVIARQKIVCLRNRGKIPVQEAERHSPWTLDVIISADAFLRSHTNVWLQGRFVLAYPRWRQSVSSGTGTRVRRTSGSMASPSRARSLRSRIRSA